MMDDIKRKKRYIISYDSNKVMSEDNTFVSFIHIKNIKIFKNKRKAKIELKKMGCCKNMKYQIIEVGVVE
jgi:hypothetical protein